MNIFRRSREYRRLRRRLRFARTDWKARLVFADLLEERGFIDEAQLERETAARRILLEEEQERGMGLKTWMGKTAQIDLAFAKRIMREYGRRKGAERRAWNAKRREAGYPKTLAFVEGTQLDFEAATSFARASGTRDVR